MHILSKESTKQFSTHPLLLHLYLQTIDTSLSIGSNFKFPHSPWA